MALKSKSDTEDGAFLRKSMLYSRVTLDTSLVQKIAKSWSDTFLEGYICDM